MHIVSVTICHSGISNRGLQKHWNERWEIIQKWLQQTKFSILQWRFWRVSISFSNNTFIVLSFHKPTWQKIRDPKCRENTLIKYNEDNYLSPGSQRLQYGWKKTHTHTSWSIGQEKVLPTRISHYIPRQSSVKTIKEVSERELWLELKIQSGTKSVANHV